MKLKALYLISKTKLKYWNLKKWKNYLEFTKNPKNYRGCAPLSIGSIENIFPAKYKDLFQDLPEYQELINKYHIPEIFNKENGYEKAHIIMEWLTQHTYYSGAQTKLLPDNSLKILQFSVDRGFKHAINCRDKAIVLTDLLLAHGIKAYPIQLEDGNHWGSHFVVHVFCEDIKKWVVFDPSFGCCFTNESNLLLNIFELRDLLLNNRMPNLIGYAFNGTKECQNVYIQYFIGATLTNITTWKSNSNEGRNTNNILKRKSFSSALPDVEKNQKEGN